MRKPKPAWVKDLARDFILRHLKMAEQVYKSSPELGKRYVDLAVRASRKYNVRLPDQYRRRVCKRCHALLIPGYNAVVRRSNKSIIWICKECGYVRRYGYAQEKSKGVETTGKNRKKGSDRRGGSRAKKTSRKGRPGEGEGAKK